MTCRQKYRGWGGAAAIGPEIFDGLRHISEKHHCHLGTLVGICVAAQLDSWEPDFRVTMASIFGKDAKAALDALHLEGWLTAEGRPHPPGETVGGGSETGGGSLFRTPVDALAEAWTGAGGGEVPGLTKRRIHNQLAALTQVSPSRLTGEAAVLYRKIFPKGSFQSFATDAYRFGGSLDEAAVAVRGIEIGKEAIARWKSIWGVATRLQPGTRGAGDPYLFFCAALNPSFDESEFRRGLVSYSVWDALALASSRKHKKHPDIKGLRSAD